MVSLKLLGHLFEAEGALETMGIVQSCTPCCLALSPLPAIYVPSAFLQKPMHSSCAPAESPKG